MLSCYRIHGLNNIFYPIPGVSGRVRRSENVLVERERSQLESDQLKSGGLRQPLLGLRHQHRHLQAVQSFLPRVPHRLRLQRPHRKYINFQLLKKKKEKNLYWSSLSRLHAITCKCSLNGNY